MSRLGVCIALVSSVAFAACGKPAAQQAPQQAATGGDVGKSPGTTAVPMTAGGAGSAASGPAKVDDRLRLHADEGTLAITPPADAKAGAEATVAILVTPKEGYHVNTEFPIDLKLDTPAGVTLAKAELKAGGAGKDKGDADALDEQHLALSVKLTAAAAGSYTINGSFKFAVCDHDSCLAKKEPIAITVAAK